MVLHIQLGSEGDWGQGRLDPILGTLATLPDRLEPARRRHRLRALALTEGRVRNPSRATSTAKIGTQNCVPTASTRSIRRRSARRVGLGAEPILAGGPEDDHVDPGETHGDDYRDHREPNAATGRQGLERRARPHNTPQRVVRNCRCERAARGSSVRRQCGCPWCPDLDASCADLHRGPRRHSATRRPDELWLGAVPVAKGCCAQAGPARSSSCTSRAADAARHGADPLGICIRIATIGLPVGSYPTP